MAGFNSEKYLLDQVEKQYIKERKSKFKHLIKKDSIKTLLKDYNGIDLKSIHKQLIKLSVQDIQKLVKNNNLSYDVIVAAYLKAILMNNDDFNSVIYINLDAIKQAKSLKYSDNNHSLYGIPILVKANVGVRNLPLTAGSYALKNLIPKVDSPVIANVKKYGGIILGLTNLSEFANYMTSNSANGYSTLGGQTKNPYGQFDVGGSSSGSAVSVALNFAPVAIGTETAGSIIYPSSQNGVIGLKPSQGLISKCGIVPISSTYDTAGPMGKNSEDVLSLLEIMSDQMMNLKTMTESDLKSIKIAVINNEEIKAIYRQDDEELLLNFTKVLKDHVKTLDYIRIDKKLFNLDIGDILKGEFKEDLNDFFKKQNSKLTLEQVIKMNKKETEALCPYGQDLLVQSNESEFSKKHLKECIDENKAVATKALMTIFDDYDFILSISNYMTTSYTCSGVPAVNFPVAQRDSGEPFGVTLIGQMHEDERLLKTVQIIRNIMKN